MSEKIAKTPIDKSLFFLANLFIIASFNNTVSLIFFSSWLFTYLVLLKGNTQKKFMVYIPALIFVIPPLIIQGVTFTNNTLHLNIDYFIFMRVITTLTASAIYITTMAFKEFCNLMVYLKIPNFIIEIIIFMHKFITLTLKNYKEYLISHKNRAGKFNIRTVSNLAINIFTKLHRDLKNMELALYTRGYQNYLPFTKSTITFNTTNFIITIIYLTASILIFRGVPI